MTGNRTHRGFTLIELVVVISILAILAGVLVPRVSTHMRSSRDEARLTDVKALKNAIDQYFMDKGEYPAAEASSAAGGWDVSHDGGFIGALVQEGYLTEQPADPVNDVTFHYRYYVYNQGSYGCQGDGPFYVLGVKNFESAAFAARNRGFFRCANRNWGNEFAFVTGGGASFRQ